MVGRRNFLLGKRKRVVILILSLILTLNFYLATFNVNDGRTSGQKSLENEKILVKTTPNPEWIQFFNTSDGGVFMSLDVDGDNIVTAGYVDDFMGMPEEALVVKYNSSGHSQWNRTWDLAEEAQDVAVDNNHNIYVTGHVIGSGYDVFLVKYNSSGDQVWNKTWEGSLDDWSYGIDIDSNNSIYIAGGTASFGTDSDVLLVKYDSDGNLLWNRTWNKFAFPPSAKAYDITIDDFDNIYLTGYNHEGVIANFAFLLKYNSSGFLQWNHSWSYGFPPQNYGNSVAVDKNGSVYVSGSTYIIMNKTSFITKYNSSGSVLWSYIWNASSIELEDMVVTSENIIYLTGHYQFNGSVDVLIGAFSFEGRQLWNQTWGGASWDVSLGIGTDDAGHLYVAGASTSFGGGLVDPYLMKLLLPAVLEPILPNPSSNGKINLDWSYATIPMTYYIYRDTSPINSTDGLSPIATVSTRNHTDYIGASGTYYYAIVASIGLSNSSLSNCENVTVVLPPVFPPTLDPILPNPSTTGTINLNWSSVINATNYYIYRDTSFISVAGALSPIANVTATNYTEFIGTFGTYYYAIVATAPLGNSTTSNCESVTIAFPLTNPPTLDPILPNPSTMGTINLNWSSVVNATIYYIYRDTVNITSTTGLSPIANVVIANYSELYLSNGTLFYVIVAGNAVSNTSISNCENVTLILTAPEVPILHTITPNPSFTGIINLNWNSSIDATHYNIYRNETVILSVAGLTPIGSSLNASYIDNVTNTGTYYYVIIAENLIGNSSISNCENVTVWFQPKSPTLDPILPNPSINGIISLNWSTDATATNYYVFRDVSPINSTDGLSPIANVTMSNYLDIILFNTIRYYVIVAENPAGNSSLSSCENLTISIPPPSSPILNPITPTNDEDGIIQLNWDDFSNATRYFVYRSTAPISSIAGETPIATVFQSMYVDTLTTNGRYYYVVVVEASWQENSTISNCISVNVAIPPIPTWLLILLIGVVIGAVAAVSSYYIKRIRPSRAQKKMVRKEQMILEIQGNFKTLNGDLSSIQKQLEVVTTNDQLVDLNIQTEQILFELNEFLGNVHKLGGFGKVEKDEFFNTFSALRIKVNQKTAEIQNKFKNRLQKRQDVILEKLEKRIDEFKEIDFAKQGISLEEYDSFVTDFQKQIWAESKRMTESLSKYEKYGLSALKAQWLTRLKQMQIKFDHIYNQVKFAKIEVVHPEPERTEIADRLIPRSVLTVMGQDFRGISPKTKEIIQEIERLLTLGKKYGKEGNLNEAFHCYDTILKLNPLTVPAWLELVHLYQITGDIQRALMCAKRATQLNPSDPYAWESLGISNSMSGDDQSAIRCFHKAIYLDPTRFISWSSLGILYDKTGDLQKALYYTKKATEISPSGSGLQWMNLGAVYRSLGQENKAFECHLKATEVDPENYLAWWNMAGTYSRHGDEKKSLESFKKGFLYKGEIREGASTEEWYNLGLKYKQQDLYLGAACFKLALEIDDSYSSAWTELGNIYSKLNNRNEARACFRRARGARVERRAVQITTDRRTETRTGAQIDRQINSRKSWNKLLGCLFCLTLLIWYVFFQWGGEWFVIGGVVWVAAWLPIAIIYTWNLLRIKDLEKQKKNS